MEQVSAVDTSPSTPDTEPGTESIKTGGFLATATVSFFLKVAASSTYALHQRFFEESSATRIPAGSLAESSTQIREMAPAAKVQLNAILNAAKRDIIEDGMYNAINQRLPGLIAEDYKSVMPALMSVIEGRQLTPIIAAEVLKELGRLRNAASHASRLWVLERALSLSSPFIRDGAGLGLAMLADPHAIPYLYRAIENESSVQTRADLQLVIDELNEIATDGAPVASNR